MGAEFELKYRTSDGVLEQIEALLGGAFCLTDMHTTYFDTPQQGISRRRWMLRIRRENEMEVCTLKTPGANGVRGEWEIPWDRLQQMAEELCKLEGLAELPSVLKEGLVESCGARFVRKSMIVEGRAFTAELALDRGILFGGSRKIPFAEVEVELKSGSREAMEAYAADLAEKFELEIEHLSKFARALALRQED